MAELANLSPDDLDAIGEKARRRALQFGWDGFVARMDAHVEELAGMRDEVRARPPVTAPTSSPLPVLDPRDPAVTDQVAASIDVAVTTVQVAVGGDAPVTLG